MHQLNAISAGLRLPEKSEAPAAANGRGFCRLTKLDLHFPADSAIALPRVARTLGVDNLRGASDDARATVIEQTRRIVAEHGPDPCTRPQAAAHEAGHVVAAWALLGEARAVRVTTHRYAGRTLWLGSTEPPRGNETRRDRRTLLCRAAIGIAGLAGEHFAKLSHPASSIDELHGAHLVCDYLDGVHGMAPGTHAAMVGALVPEALGRNEALFDLIRRTLEGRRSMTAKHVSAAMARGVRIEVSV